MSWMPKDGVTRLLVTDASSYHRKKLKRDLVKCPENQGATELADTKRCTSEP